MRSGPVPIGPGMLLEVWSEATLRDLELWLLSDRLPPGASFEEMASLVEYARRGKALESRLEDANSEILSLRGELEDANSEILSLQNQLKRIG